MLSQINQLKEINKLIKDKDIKDILFVDSYGGILNLLNIIETYKLNKNCLIISSNKNLSNFINNFYKKKFTHIIVDYNSMFIKDFILNIFLFFFVVFSSKKINRFFAYKLNIDYFKYYIINIFSNNKTKIIVHDQFIKSFKFKKNIPFFKKIVLILINTLCKIKINLFYHFDRGSALLPSLNYELNKKFKKIYNWNYFRQKFNNKFYISQNSLLLIDETTINFMMEKFIEKKNYSKLIFPKIKKFIKKKKINNVYLKLHPTSADINFFLKYKFPNKKILKGSMPIELIINKFKFVILSVSSAISYCEHNNIYTYVNNYNFKSKSMKRKLYKFLKKNSGNNYKKLKFLL